jgi:hypothetical protein
MYNMPYEIIPYIATPTALIAFIIAVLANTYRARTRQDLDLVKSAPEDQRAKIITTYWEREGLDRFNPGNLSREQRYDLLNRTLQQRDTRLLTIAIVAIVITLILAVLIGIIVLTGQASPQTESTAAVTPTVGLPPVIVELLASYAEDELAPNEYIIADNTSWTPEAAGALIRLTKLSEVILENEQAAYEATFVIENKTSENISLTVTSSFFKVEDNRGLVSKQLYFCCSTNNTILAPNQKREVKVFFENLWMGGKYEPPASPPEVQLIVRGLAPITRASWNMPLLLTAD